MFLAINVPELIALLAPILAPALKTILTLVIVGVVGKLFDLMRKKSTLLDDEKEVILQSKITDALKLGISEVMETYVDEIKDKSADGRLTADEAREAKGKAIEIAKKILKERGIDIGKEIGATTLELLINYLVEKFKLPKNV